MSYEKIPTDVPENLSSLEQIQIRFETWRQRRKKRTRIPKSLWEAAVGLSEEYSVSHLSKALRVNHTALKRQIEKMRPAQDSVPHASTTFLELPIPPLNTVPECTVEIFRNDGAVMKMHLKGNSGSDFLEMSKAFWTNGS